MEKFKEVKELTRQASGVKPAGQANGDANNSVNSDQGNVSNVSNSPVNVPKNNQVCNVLP